MHQGEGIKSCGGPSGSGALQGARRQVRTALPGRARPPVPAPRGGGRGSPEWRGEPRWGQGCQGRRTKTWRCHSVPTARGRSAPRLPLALLSVQPLRQAAAPLVPLPLRTSVSLEGSPGAGPSPGRGQQAVLRGLPSVPKVWEPARAAHPPSGASPCPDPGVKRVCPAPAPLCPPPGPAAAASAGGGSAVPPRRERGH